MTDFLKASRASTRDLEIDAKINKIAEQAIIKKQPEIPYPIAKKNGNETQVRSTNYTADLAIRDIILDCEIEKIAESAIQDKLGWKPSKIKSPVTQQMIDEAQAEAIKPISIGGVNYRYRPSGLPIPILKPPPKLEHVLTPAEVLAEETNKKHIITLIKQVNADIVKQRQNLQILDDTYSSNPENPNIIGKSREQRMKELKTLYVAQQRELCTIYGLDKTGAQPILIGRLLDHEFQNVGSEVQYNKQKAKIEKAIMDDYDVLAQCDADLRVIDVVLGQNDKFMKDNDASIFANNQENKQTLNAYADDLNVLNQGKFSLAQLAGESDDDFRQRLIETGQSTMTDNEIMDSANLQNIVTAKYNLKEILNNSGQIETISKKLLPDERFLMNKQFPRVKKAFIDTYGINNKTISDQEAVDFIKLVIATPITIAPLQPQIPITSSPVSASPVSVSSVSAPPQTPLRASTLKNDLQTLAAISGITISSTDTIYDIIVALDDNGTIIQDGFLNQVDPTIIRQLESEGRLNYYISTQSPAPTTGSGIGTHRYPKLSRFGKVTISPDKLYYKNTLVIKSPHGKAITGLKNTRVSDAMVSILLKILDGGKISKSELNLLSPHEKQLYDTLMVMSGGHKVHENTVDNSAREMKHRLELIGGEMDAGNNNELLLKELHALLHRMAHTGLISTPKAAKYYSDVKKHYY